MIEFSGVEFSAVSFTTASWIMEKFFTDNNGNDALAAWASLATIILTIAAPITYFLDFRKEKKREIQQNIDERENIEKNLQEELADILNNLDRTKYKDDAISFLIKPGDEVFYMNRNLNHDIYDSLIYSGKIGIFEPKLQQRVQIIFGFAKRHNEILKIVSELQDENDGKIPPTAYKYYRWMDNTETKLLDEIPKVLEKFNSN